MIVKSLPPDPAIIRNIYKNVRKKKQDQKSGQTDNALQPSAENKIKDKVCSDRGGNESQCCGDKSVSVFAEFYQSDIENVAEQIEGKQDLDDLKPGIIDIEYAILFGCQDPCKDRRYQNIDSVLQNSAENEPYGGLERQIHVPVPLANTIYHVFYLTKSDIMFAQPF